MLWTICNPRPVQPCSEERLTLDSCVNEPRERRIASSNRDARLSLRLPCVAHGSAAGVGVGAVGKLAIEFGGKRPAAGVAHLGANRDEREIGRRRDAIDDE